MHELLTRTADRNLIGMCSNIVFRIVVYVKPISSENHEVGP